MKNVKHILYTFFLIAACCHCTQVPEITAIDHDNDELSGYKNLADEHNRALEYIYLELSKTGDFSEAKVDISRGTKKYTNERFEVKNQEELDLFIRNKSDIFSNLNDLDQQRNYEYSEIEYFLSNQNISRISPYFNQKTFDMYLDFKDRIFEITSFEEIDKVVDEFEQEVFSSLEFEQRQVLLAAAELFRGSSKYWYENGDKWQKLAGNDNFKILEPDPWYIAVSSADLDGLITGLVGGFIEGGLFGSIGGPAGSLLGALGGATIGSVVGSVVGSAWGAIVYFW